LSIDYLVVSEKVLSTGDVLLSPESSDSVLSLLVLSNNNLMSSIPIYLFLVSLSSSSEEGEPSDLSALFGILISILESVELESSQIELAFFLYLVFYDFIFLV
jgi:hypothetical protein